jgi:hypothetical protein
VAYAAERTQGGQAIINYPDVKRMLLTIRSHTEAMRALAYYVAKNIDLGHKSIVDLLIPVLKSHATDLGFLMSSEAVQVFGGMGYVAETGISQNMRDARIAMIYEGTNGIQAMDLVMRKITMNDGALFADLVSDIKGFYYGTAYEKQVAVAVDRLAEATKHVRGLALNDKEKAGFVAAYYLKMFGIVMGAVMLAAQGKAANLHPKKHEKLETVKFYMDYILPEVDYLAAIL